MRRIFVDREQKLYYFWHYTKYLLFTFLRIYTKVLYLFPVFVFAKQRCELRGWFEWLTQTPPPKLDIDVTFCHKDKNQKWMNSRLNTAFHTKGRAKVYKWKTCKKRKEENWHWRAAIAGHFPKTLRTCWHANKGTEELQGCYFWQIFYHWLTTFSSGCFGKRDIFNHSLHIEVM